MTAIEQSEEMHAVDELGFGATINPIEKEQEDHMDKQPGL